MSRLPLAAIALLVPLLAPAADPDPYEKYVTTSKDFQPVKQDADWLRKAYPSWLYMPWTYKWTAGYTDASGEWAQKSGYNGAFIDHGDVGEGKLKWIDKFGFHFYVDHLAGKGDLHMWDGGIPDKFKDAVNGGGVRTVPVNDELKAKLEKHIKQHATAVKDSPNRAAYALDDELSWGHFVHPIMWCVTDDKAAYPAWLKEVYGAHPPERAKWVTYEDVRPKLAEWKVKDFDASPLLDQWSFNDSYWNNFLGDLVEYSNSVDPDTPCGYVGGQSPNAFGGYDYAKLMKKVQFLEAYNIGGSQSVIRSFNPHNAIPTVTTHFHQKADDTAWQTWYYLAHGNKGFIGWVDGWFEGKTPKAWHAEVAPNYKQAGEKIGPLMTGAEWVHDGVAIYYSHPSIQLGWVLDAAAHGKTWVNRNGDDRLGSSHQGRKAWENMLRDSGTQYSYVGYADVIAHGVPKEYRVLILPACLCLSDVEAKRIREFAEAGGTVIADYLPGVWDQHGKGRVTGGALDDLFGVKHSPDLTAADLFAGGKLWCELDQDRHFNWKTYKEFLGTDNKCLQEDGFDKAVRAMEVNTTKKVGKGSAVLLNLSPQWYNAHREAGPEAAKKREVFLKPIEAAVGKRWAEVIAEKDGAWGCEVTYWQAGKRTLVFVVMNPETAVSSTGGGNSVGLKAATVPVTLKFAGKITGVKDERTGKKLPDGTEFAFDWKTAEAVVLSFDGGPSRGK